ncbi:MAG TPA: hypothetical protein VMN03_02395, partial [Burkholderiales bacterium]|nr:hypothetical protein [Burkholderiales bacterium]
YFEVAAVIVVLVLLGQVLELRAREKTGGALRALLDLAPPTAHRLLPQTSACGSAQRFAGAAFPVGRPSRLKRRR